MDISVTTISAEDGPWQRSELQDYWNMIAFADQTKGSENKTDSDGGLWMLSPTLIRFNTDTSSSCSTMS